MIDRQRGTPLARLVLLLAVALEFLRQRQQPFGRVLAPLVGHLFASDPEQRVVRERGKDLIELLLAARFVAELGIARGENAVRVGNAGIVLNRQEQLRRRLVKPMLEEMGFADQA